MAVDTDAAILHVLGQQPRLKDGDRDRFVQLLGESEAAVDRYLAGAAVPDAIRLGAIYRATYHDWWSRMVGDSRGAAGGEYLRPTRGARGVLRASGAEAMLAPWRIRRAGICR